MRADVRQEDEPVAVSGFSLMEVVVAVLVLSIATIGLFRVFDQSVLAASANRDRLLAQLVARNRLEQLQIGETEFPDRVEFAGRDWLVDMPEKQTSGPFREVRIIVRPATGDGGASLVTYQPDRDLP